MNMKATNSLLAAGILAVFCCSVGNAQISYSNSLVGATLIYSNNFNLGSSGVNISNTPPNVANSVFGGSSTATWQDVLGIHDTNSTGPVFFGADGTVPGTPDSIVLPFTPQSGYVYTLTASLTFSGSPGSWVGLGFAQRIPTNANTGYGRFSDGGSTPPNQGPNGYDWIILTESSGNVQFFKGAGGGNQLISQNGFFAANSPATHTVKLILDTTRAQWGLAAYVDDKQASTNSIYSSGNPTIGAVGITENTLGAPGTVQWNTLALSATPLTIVQEPVAGYVSPGHAFTNTVAVASGTTPFSQWYFNTASNYAGATALTNTPEGRIYSSGTLTNSLVITNVHNSDQGYYFVIATNTSGSVTSDIVPLVVPVNVTITSQFPVTYTNMFTLYAGTSPQFSVSAAGSPPIHYQWYTNGVACSGQTNATFTWANVQVGTLSNYCMVTNNTSATSSVVWTASVIADPTAPFPTNLLALQPVGYWRLNEGPDDGSGNNGAVALDYAGGNDGIYTNVYLGNPGYSSSTDSNETSVLFGSFPAGEDDVFGIQGIDFSAPANTSVTFSVEAWVNGNLIQTSGAGILAKGYGGAEQFVLDVFGGNYRFALHDAAGNLYSAAATTGPTGGWDYLVGVCDEVHSNVTLYVNGVPAASVAIAPGSGLLASSVPMTIGARSSAATTGYNDLQFKGYANDVAVLKSALSFEQVATLYTNAGYSITLSFVPPPPTFVYQANKTLTIPASGVGAPNLGYYWTDLTTGAQLASGAINGYATLDATLRIPNASYSLSGDQLQLVITNDTTYNSWTVALFTPPPPVTLDYSDPILYSNYFEGGAWTIVGQPLTAANALVGGTNAMWVNALGTNTTGSLQASGIDATTAPPDSWELPFAPRAGYVYTLNVSLTFSGNPGNWVGLGFAQRIPINATNGYGRFSDGGTTPPQQGPNGYDWIILTESSGNVQYFVGPGGSGQITNMNGFFTGNSPATHSVQVVLDTTGAHWQQYAYVDGISAGTNTYSSNPPIGAVGITQTTLSTPAFVQWNYFALSQEAPGGVPPYLFAPLPPASVTLLADASLAIPASAFGSVPVGYYWSNTNTAAVLGSGATNNVAPLVANLSVSDVPLSWNGNTLALIVTNAYGTNISLVSLIVTNAVNPNPGPIQFSVADGLLTMSWPTNLGWTLQAQTNSPGVGLTTNWVNVPGSTAITNVVVPVSPTNGSVFYRLHLVK